MPPILLHAHILRFGYIYNTGKEIATDFSQSVGEIRANTSCLVLFVIRFFVKQMFSHHKTLAWFSKMN